MTEIELEQLEEIKPRNRVSNLFRELAGHRPRIGKVLALHRIKQDAIKRWAAAGLIEVHYYEKREDEKKPQIKKVTITQYGVDCVWGK